MLIVIAASGWREHEDMEFVTTEMLTLASILERGGHHLFFRVGDNKGRNRKLGADQIIQSWLKARYPSRYQVYDANWDALGNYAGPDRNRNMLTGSLDPYGLASILIAFPQPGIYRYRDSGTWGCCKEAFRLGIRVEIPAYRLEVHEVSN